MTTRQQRRASARSQLKIVKKPTEFDDAINNEGSPSTQYSMEELMHKMGQATVEAILSDPEETEKVIQLAQGVKFHVAQITSQAMRQLQMTIMPIECGKGCDYCCYLNVLVSPVEAINIASYLQSNLEPEKLKEVTERLRVVATRVAALATPSDRDGAHIPCGLLEDHQCLAYKARPLSCLGWTSAAKSDCKDSYEGKAAGLEFRLFGPLFTAATAISAGMTQGLHKAGLDYEMVELNAAVLTALTTSDCEKRWMLGEKMFDAAVNNS